MIEASRESVDVATARIGTRLSELRTKRNLRISELARRASVSPSLISQIERGASRPSVGTLFSVALVLGVPVDAFFAEAEEDEPAELASVTELASANRAGPAARGDAEPGPHKAARRDAARTDAGAHEAVRRDVVRRGERASIDIRGGVRWERLTASPLDGVEFLELVYAPGAESDGQAYRHPGIELVLVTDGVMTIFLGFEQHNLFPGDSIAFPSSTPHRYVNLTVTETRAITVILRDDLSTLELRDPPPE